MPDLMFRLSLLVPPMRASVRVHHNGPLDTISSVFRRGLLRAQGSLAGFVWQTP